ncbi:MAG: c-type cytochrome [Planctomycetes bacterium]|nr:c-type cytochrome [Planctomycetota bacterium]
MFFSEGASYTDFDRDGFQDVVSGPHVYFGPDFKEGIELYSAAPFNVQGYSDNFFAFPHDVNHDGWVDAFFVGFPGKDAYWFLNPGGATGESANAAGSQLVRDSNGWERFLAMQPVDNESPQFEDINGDGRPDLLCQSGDRLGWAEYSVEDPQAPWTFHPVSTTGIGGRFTHGLGVGDMNGDGRKDLLLKQGWWQQPPPLEGDSEWQFIPYTFAGRGGAQMYVYDVDGDGDSDVITADNAHGYGLAWFERLGSDLDQRPVEFRKHSILGSAAAENPYSLVIGNLHAMDLIDMDGDGLKDLVTGARFWAHGGNDKADHDPALLYWFQLQRGTAGVEFIPQMIDLDCGVGTQVVAGDLNGDDLPDVVVGNKKGTFVLHHKTEAVAAGTYRARLLQAVVDNKNRAGDSRMDGVHPVDSHGKDLNLGFELGDMSGWTVEGKAFEGQPIKGDNVFKRRPPWRSHHQGEYWIGTYEVLEDGPLGTMTSAPFAVTHPYASFLIAGGSHAKTCVQILDAANGDIIFQSSGKNTEEMSSRWVDLSQRIGQEIQIRLMDQEAGGWGHINYDDFRFHADSEEVRKRVQEDMPRDMVKGFTPEQAAARMTLPDGFHSDLIAGEPRLHQPIAMTFDARGRIWVAEAYSYPVRRPDDEARDHILVFEDTNKDGNFDKRTVFLDNLNLVSGLEVGHGGVWIGAAPYLMFVPDENDDLIPDGDPQTLLDGWGYQDTHETLNAFNWGPDGWLYGCHGVFTHSRVGKPGTPDDQRTPMNAGVWRYHPTRHQFEVFAWGSSNPWGVDFDDRGQAVITACVIPHLYHVIQGARYQRQGGQHFNPFVFDDIKTVADHLHYLGATPHSGNGNSDSVGGGHAHCGAVIYLADQFPEEYRNRLFVFNVHGKRMNSELLLPKNSGLVGAHAPDFMLANDKWFLGVAMRVGPDGSLYFIDWYDKQACHRREVEIWDRSNGRLFRVRYGDLNPANVNLADATTEELIQYQLHANDWYVRTARRILAERGPDPAAAEQLAGMLLQPQTPEVELRLLWALNAVGGFSEDWATLLMSHNSNPYLRAWAIQLALDQSTADGTAAKLPSASTEFLRKLELMTGDDSPVVRLYLASALQRLPLNQRRGIAKGLMRHAASADDHNLPLMIWYGIEPWVAANPQQALQDMNEHCAIPLLQDFTYRRLAAGGGEGLDLLCQAAAVAHWDDAARMIFEITKALQSRPDTPMPPSWQKVSARFLSHGNEAASSQSKDQVTALALGFGDTNAALPLRGLLNDPQQPVERRERALDGLLQVQDPQLLSILQQLLDDPAMRLQSIQKLAAFDEATTPKLLLDKLSSFNLAEQGAVANTLASRASFAQQFLQAIIEDQAPAALLDSATLRLQLAQLNDPTTNELLTVAWGRSTELSAEAAQKIARYAEMLSDEFLATADLSNGRALYKRTCWVCHDLFGDGMKVGPGLTGSNRANLNYILTNIIDPSAEVGREYLLTRVRLLDGRVVSGMVVDENNVTITLQSGLLKETVRKSKILKDSNGQLRITRSAVSLMPPGQLQGLTNEEVRDLIAYLASAEQVPLPE